MNFDLNINVQIGVTPQLATFLTALLQSRPETPATLPAIEAPAPEPAESEKPRRKRQAKIDAPEVENPEAEAPAAPVEEAPAKQTEKSTGEMIREIMHRTRIRFEGEDYKENTSSEGYAKYHRKLTGLFKSIAATLGAEKPSLLESDSVEAFAKACDELTTDKDGNIITDLPF